MARSPPCSTARPCSTATSSRPRPAWSVWPLSAPTPRSRSTSSARLADPERDLGAARAAGDERLAERSGGACSELLVGRADRDRAAVLRLDPHGACQLGRLLERLLVAGQQRRL